MERILEGAGFSRVESDEGESRRLLEGSSRGSGFCIVSMATPPDVLSNYHLVLPTPLHPAVTPRSSAPTTFVLWPPKTAGGMAGNVTGYTKRWSLPRTFLTTNRDRPWFSLCRTHLYPPTRTVAFHAEGRYETFNLLFRSIKNSEAPWERRPIMFMVCSR